MNPKEIIKSLINDNPNVSSIAELERTLGISNGTINKWDKSNPSPATLGRVADYFGVTVDYLLGRESKKDHGKQELPTDLNEILDSMMSFDGKPMTDSDREAIRAYLEGRLSNK